MRNKIESKILQTRNSASFWQILLYKIVTKVKKGGAFLEIKKKCASLTSAPCQNFQASQAVHGRDDITTENLLSQVKCVPQALNLLI